MIKTKADCTNRAYIGLHIELLVEKMKKIDFLC